MRFPFSLTYFLSRYILGQKLHGRKNFPLVLMLEPLHACNLRCSGCGRIREYADTLGKHLSVVECLDSVKECSAPIVSVCGGEPLLYPKITELIDEILNLSKHIYLCTNGTLLENRLPDFESIKNKHLKSRLYWNVHLDGPESVHDLIVERNGVFQKAICGITAAKKAGFYVYTNTTLYKQTTLDDLLNLCRQLEKIGIDGVMLAPGFGYESVGNDSIFLSRDETHGLFRQIREKMGKFRITTTPIYMDYLCGDISLSCAAFANPTRNIAGWKGPCYLVTDKHYGTYDELVHETDWSKIGPGNDPRCEHCLSHCGFEPAAVFATNSVTNVLRMGFWQLGF